MCNIYPFTCSVFSCHILTLPVITDSATSSALQLPLSRHSHHWPSLTHPFLISLTSLAVYSIYQPISTHSFCQPDLLPDPRFALYDLFAWFWPLPSSTKWTWTFIKFLSELLFLLRYFSLNHRPTLPSLQPRWWVRAQTKLLSLGFVW